TQPAFREFINATKIRTSAMVALRKDQALLGAIVVHRKEVRPFTNKQIALLQNFAAQAVIAMEKARLITEKPESLEQQTATSAILRVVSGSQADTQPVFTAIVESASRLCEAECSAVAQYEGGQLQLIAINNMSSEETAAFHSLFPRAVAPNFVLGRAILEARPVNVEDILAEHDYDPRTREVLADPYQYRSFLGVPMLREGEPIGVIGCGRRRVKPFTDTQIELLNTFADQAVIAIENARLITETREALEQQTATAEVLGVINSSPGNLTPVFDAMLEKAHNLCGIAMGSLELYDGERFRAVACRGLSDAFSDILRQGYRASDNPATRPLIEGERITHIRDLAQTDYSITRSSAELDAARTLLCVPLRQEGRLLGMIASARKEVRPFTEKEIALLENFAAQAVIAMENARLITETREALEQQ